MKRKKKLNGKTKTKTKPWRDRELSATVHGTCSKLKGLFCLHFVITSLLSFPLQYIVGPVGKKACCAVISGLSIYPTYTLRESQCNVASWNKPGADWAAGHPGLDWTPWTGKVCSPHPLPARRVRAPGVCDPYFLWPCPSGLRQWAGEGSSDWLDVGELHLRKLSLSFLSEVRSWPFLILEEGLGKWAAAFLYEYSSF